MKKHKKQKNEWWRTCFTCAFHRVQWVARTCRNESCSNPDAEFQTEFRWPLTNEGHKDCPHWQPKNDAKEFKTPCAWKIDDGSEIEA